MRRLALNRMEDFVDGEHRGCRLNLLLYRDGLVIKYRHAEADVLLEADLNHLSKRQKLSGRAWRGGRRARHQPRSAGSRVPGAPHRSGTVPGFRQYQESRLQAAAAAGDEARGNRPDGAAAEPDQAPDPGPWITRDIRVQQG